MELYGKVRFPCFPKNALKQTPSSASGMDAEEECKMRRKITDFIFSFGSRKLRYPRLTIATASVFFHRYYARYPYERMPSVEATALACLLLAGKAEGTIVKLRNFCTLYHQYKGAPAPMHDSRDAKTFEGDLARQEAKVLEANEFTFWVEHPYRYFFALLRETVLRWSGHARTKALGKQGYDLITDSFATNLCVHYSPQEIATAVLHMLIQHHRIDMPPLAMSPFIPWHMALCEELSEEDLESISSTIVSNSNSNIAKDISAAKKASIGNLEAPPSLTTPLPPAVPLPPAPPPPQPTPPVTNGKDGMDSKYEQDRHTSVHPPSGRPPSVRPPAPAFDAPSRNQVPAFPGAGYSHAYGNATQADAHNSVRQVYIPGRHQPGVRNGDRRFQESWPQGVRHPRRGQANMGIVAVGTKRTRTDGMNPYASRYVSTAPTLDRSIRQRSSSSKRTKKLGGTADRPRGKWNKFT
mmetsp:Transcript_39337/g.76370  ORF Transcript_39337/g.76370 Transcript_39337/m.76370 type:complete len:467 (+) Transcript_39337:108-1508(+)